MTSTTLTVAFAGLGRMGSLMAANLARKGFDVVVHNRTLATAEAWVETNGGRIGVTPAAAVAEADVVVTMLADGDALLGVVGDAVTALRPGSLFIDMGTSGPTAVAQARQVLAAGGVDLVDAPVSGSTPGAEAGTLLIMAGATDEAYARAEPVLQALGEPIHVGPPGAGAVLKLAVNSVIFAINQAVGESVVLAETAGVDPAVTVDVIGRGAAGAPLVKYRAPNYVDPLEAPVTFTLDLAIKDQELVADAADAAGVDMPQAERTRQVTAGLIATGEGSRDLGFVVEAVRRSSSKSE